MGSNPMRMRAPLAALMFMLTVAIGCGGGPKPADKPKKADEPKEHPLAKQLVGVWACEVDLNVRGAPAMWLDHKGTVKFETITPEGEVVGSFEHGTPVGPSKGTLKGKLKDLTLEGVYNAEGVGKDYNLKFVFDKDKDGKLVSAKGSYKTAFGHELRWDLLNKGEAEAKKPVLIGDKAMVAVFEGSEWSLTYTASKKELERFAGEDPVKQKAAANFLQGKESRELTGTIVFKKAESGGYKFTQAIGKLEDTYDIVDLKIDGKKVSFKSRSPGREDSNCELEFDVKEGKAGSAKGRVWSSKIEFGMRIELK